MTLVRSLVVLAAAGTLALAQLPIDSQLAAEIAKIRAIDNHAHPVRPTFGSDKDVDYDALPVETMEPSTEPVRTRQGSPLALEASHALFGNAQDYRQRKRQVLTEKGAGYANWVLDQLGIETMLANRVAMGPGLAPPRFLWVPFEDALMYPLNNSSLAAKNSDRKAFFADEDRLLQRYLKESGYSELPASFEDYLKKLVTATLERHKRGGAIAVKFEAAYLRSLQFDDPTQAEAARVYSNSRRAAPPDASYKILQDYIFRYIASECGRLGLAVHLHSAAGAGGYFHVAEGNPLGLESVLNDPKLRKTNFVMLHGGWPFTREVAALLSKPNAYTDFSSQTFTNYPRAVAGAIREWLEYAPERVMFATDAYPFSEEMYWEEAGWVAATTGRQALGLALTEMMRDGEITRARAIEIAHMVLRDNARKLYNLP
ncbi:MAG TPA: amidohydrolase family protein [Bryobacteraceae bacterium]|jgi:predicted TIM-barrel fold metal-dependent hydrolase|nr:amidohydrolase family protein [Bryobacteraceae bacterium]